MADGLRQVYQRVFTTLDPHFHEEPAFDVFRDILRKALLDLWPLDADDTVFGHVLTERRIHHSVGTAAK